MIEAAQKADIITPDTIPGAGQITQLRDDIWWVRMPLPFRLNHVNLYVLRGDDGLTIIDAGLHSKETASHWRRLLAAPPFTQYAVRRILITHHHPDHVGFAATLAEMTGAEVLMSAVEEQKHRVLGAMGDAEFAALMAARYQEYGFGDDIITPLAGRGNHYSDKIKLLGAVRVLRAGDVLAGLHGTWQLRFDCGHSDAHIGLYDMGRRIYLCGDFLLPRITPNIAMPLASPPKDVLGHYFNYLDEMAEWGDDWLVLPGHDWAFHTLARRARDLIRHHRHRLDLLQEAAVAAAATATAAAECGGGGLTVAAAMDVLFPMQLNAHERYFASGEAAAHLYHLHQQKALQCTIDSAGVARYGQNA